MSKVLEDQVHTLLFIVSFIPYFCLLVFGIFVTSDAWFSLCSFRLAHLVLQNINKDYVIFSWLCRQKWPKTKNGMNETMNINHLFCPEVAPEVEKKSITYILTWGTSLNVTGQANIAIAKIATMTCHHYWYDSCNHDWLFYLDHECSKQCKKGNCEDTSPKPDHCCSNNWHQILKPTYKLFIFRVHFFFFWHKVVLLLSGLFE